MHIDASTFVMLAVLIASVSFALGHSAAMRKARAVARGNALSPALRYLHEHAVRFACAQHWARGALLSSPSEPWRPIVSSMALAALAVEDTATLVQLAGSQTGQAGVDAEVANVWRAARAELMAERDRLQFGFLAGVSPDGAPQWNYARLLEEAAKQLADAHTAGEQLVQKRHQPHAFS